jgi:hypothetical protein
MAVVVRQRFRLLAALASAASALACGGAAPTRTPGGGEGYDLVGVEAMIDEARTKSHADATQFLAAEIGPAALAADGTQTWWAMDEAQCAVVTMAPAADPTRHAAIETTYLHDHDDGFADCQAKAAAPPRS